jgi:starvation-inducible DNA-binding protein
MSKSFSTRNDLPTETRAEVISTLNQSLADFADLYSQVKYAHWNIKGPNFIAIHKLLDEFAESLEEAIDEIAERATSLGGLATGTLRQAAAASKLAEFPGDVYEALKVVAVLADRYAALAKSTRANIKATDELGDDVTSDYYTSWAKSLDQSLWFLEAHLN